MIYKVEIKPRSLFGKTLRLPPSLNARVHWAMRSKWVREFCEESFYAFKKAHVPNLGRATLTIINNAVQVSDYDNLAASAKPLIDGMILAGVLVEDDPEHLVELRLRSQRVLHKADERVFMLVEGCG